jgi:hypothetical protein
MQSTVGRVSEAAVTWGILSEIETADGNPTAAAEAKRKAIDGYLAYCGATAVKITPPMAATALA